MKITFTFIAACIFYSTSAIKVVSTNDDLLKLKFKFNAEAFHGDMVRLGKASKDTLDEFTEKAALIIEEKPGTTEKEAFD